MSRPSKNAKPAAQEASEPMIPSGIDRRSFLMRNAVIGAAAVMTGAVGRPKRAPSRPRRKRGEISAASAGFQLDVARPGRREKVQRPGDDGGGGVLQGRPRPFEFAHDRADAHHLRLLPALHQAAGRPTRQGDRPQGSPVRQPERHRQGPRHRARLAGGPDRQGTGHGRSAVPRRDEREAGRRPIR